MFEFMISCDKLKRYHIREHPCLEFKRKVNLDSREGRIKLAKEVVAIANTTGCGYIIIGVDDEGNIVGTDEDKERVESVIKEYVPDIDGRIYVDYLNCDGKRVIVILVMDTLPRILFVKGKDDIIYIRSGSQIKLLKNTSENREAVLDLKRLNIGKLLFRRPRRLIIRNPKKLVDLEQNKAVRYISLILPALEIPLKQDVVIPIFEGHFGGFVTSLTPLEYYYTCVGHISGYEEFVNILEQFMKRIPMIHFGIVSVSWTVRLCPYHYVPGTAFEHYYNRMKYYVGFSMAGLLELLKDPHCRDSLVRSFIAVLIRCSDGVMYHISKTPIVTASFFSIMEGIPTYPKRFINVEIKQGKPTINIDYVELKRLNCKFLYHWHEISYDQYCQPRPGLCVVPGYTVEYEYNDRTERRIVAWRILEDKEILRKVSSKTYVFTAETPIIFAEIPAQFIEEQALKSPTISKTTMNLEILYLSWIDPPAVICHQIHSFLEEV